MVNILELSIGGESLKFPFVWLRDNCQCENCFHTSAKSRTIEWSSFNLNVKPKEVVKGTDSIAITWEDGHKSTYGYKWLQFRSFTPENQRKYDATIFKPCKITWRGDQFKDVCSKHDYNEILESDETLFKWLHDLSVYGVAIIQNTPSDETAIQGVIDRVAFSRRTHYGQKFIVQHVANTSNVAYQSSNLQMHVDLPYYEYCPGTNLLHCLVQTESEGGENVLADCHYIANFMKENYPEEYRLLTEVDVEWSDIGIEDGQEFFKLFRAPVISLDKHGEITRITFSVPQRGNYFPGPIEEVEPWFKAHGLFLELAHKFSAQFKTRQGDILTFDNIRLLHGRNGYNDSPNNVRKLIGAYIDWDEIYSKLRCLIVRLRNVEGIF